MDQLVSNALLENGFGFGVEATELLDSEEDVVGDVEGEVQDPTGIPFEELHELPGHGSDRDGEDVHINVSPLTRLSRWCSYWRTRSGDTPCPASKWLFFYEIGLNTMF